MEDEGFLLYLHAFQEGQQQKDKFVFFSSSSFFWLSILFDTTYLAPHIDYQTEIVKHSYWQVEPPAIVIATLRSLCQMLDKQILKLDTMRVLVIDEVTKMISLFNLFSFDKPN